MYVIVNYFHASAVRTGLSMLTGLPLRLTYKPGANKLSVAQSMWISFNSLIYWRGSSELCPTNVDSVELLNCLGKKLNKCVIGWCAGVSLKCICNACVFFLAEEIVQQCKPKITINSAVQMISLCACAVHVCLRSHINHNSNNNNSHQQTASINMPMTFKNIVLTIDPIAIVCQIQKQKAQFALVPHTTSPATRALCLM